MPSTRIRHKVPNGRGKGYRLIPDDRMEEHFWSKVNKTETCWLWTEAVERHRGYGRFHVHRERVTAHRYAYQITYGPIPEGLVVMHRCDVRTCVRPDHLMVGTQADNQRDMVMKGRSSRGECHPAAKATEAAVVEMRRLFRDGLSQAEIGRRFNLTSSAARSIIRGRSWKHVPGAVAGGAQCL